MKYRRCLWSHEEKSNYYYPQSICRSRVRSVTIGVDVYWQYEQPCNKYIWSPHHRWHVVIKRLARNWHWYWYNTVLLCIRYSFVILKTPRAQKTLFYQYHFEFRPVLLVTSWRLWSCNPNSSILCLCQCVHNPPVTCVYPQVMWAGLVLGGFVVTVFFASNLTAFLTVTSLHSPFTSIKEITQVSQGISFHTTSFDTNFASCILGKRDSFKNRFDAT